MRGDGRNGRNGTNGRDWRDDKNVRDGRGSTDGSVRGMELGTDQ